MSPVFRRRMKQELTNAETKKAPISRGFDWCGKRDLNPHEDKASTDFKSVVSTIPPYPRKATTPYYHKEPLNEKKVFASGGIFFKFLRFVRFLR